MIIGSNGLIFPFKWSDPSHLHLPQDQHVFNSPDILKGCEVLMGTVFTSVVALSEFRNLIIITGSIVGRNFKLFLVGAEI